jgi:hypothetical protein
VSSSTPKPELWSADSGNRDVARLDIPADARRERSFEIFCRLVVGSGRCDATHGMRVLVNGAVEWARTVPTHADGQDSLELRLRRTVPVGQPLRLTASCELHGAVRLSLSVSAEED